MDEEIVKTVETKEECVDNLDDILNSALEDFDKPMSTSSKESNVKEENPASNVKSNLQNELEDVLREASLLSPGGSDSAISNVIKELSEDAKDLQSMFDDNIEDMFDELGINDEEDGLPFFDSMMRSFLCKDILYPTMSEIQTKYPKWLDENKDKISAEEFDRYNKQYAIIKDICKNFDEECDTDTTDVKNKRYHDLLELMQKMNELGQPPTDIIGEQGSTIPDFSKFNDSQCSVM